MPVNQIAVQYVYGVGDNLIKMPPQPIIARRDPTTRDFAQLGTVWINEPDSSVWVFASITANAANWTTSAGSGVGDFTSVTIDPGDLLVTDGNVEISLGNLSVAAGNVDIGGDLTVAGTTTLNGDIDFTSTGLIQFTSTFDGEPSIALIANGGINEQIYLNSQQGTGDDSILLESALGGVSLHSESGIANAINLTASSGGGIGIQATGALQLISSHNGANAINIETVNGTISLVASDDITMEAVDGSVSVSSTNGDIDLDATAASINLTASEAVADAITITASHAAGGIRLDAGTNGILVGTTATCTPISLGDVAPSASRTITLGGGTVVTAAVTDLVDIAPDGATTNANSIKQTNICTGNVTTGQSIVNINSGTAASGTSTVNISTGTGGGTKAVNIGNADGLTTVNIRGAAVTETAGSTYDIDAVGALSLNSSGAAINVGNDAVAQAINVGTGAAARTITVGNVTGATALNVNTGTGGFHVVSGGIATIAAATDTQASPTATAVINANVGRATFTGFTTAAAASQVFTITNSLVSATSAILVTVSNEGGNDAQMSLRRVNRGAGSFTVTAINNGAAALNGNVGITFFILS